MRSVNEVGRQMFAGLHHDCHGCDEGCCCDCYVSGVMPAVVAAIVKRDAEVRADAERRIHALQLEMAEGKERRNAEIDRLGRLLASPEHDAAVAAKALRRAADGMVLRHVTSSPEIDPLDYDTSLDYAEALAETYLYVQADLIEREGGRDA